MKRLPLILGFIFFTLIFDINKCFAQDTVAIRDTVLINTFNTLISNVDKCSIVDTTIIVNDIDSVQIDSLNILYFVTRVYIDKTDGGGSNYAKIYVIKYKNNNFSIIDSTPSFIYFMSSLNIGVHKDSLFIHFEARSPEYYTYIFNRHLQIYQLISFGGAHSYNEDILSSNYDIKKQLLSWKIVRGYEKYTKSGKKKIPLPKDFPIQLREFNTPLFVGDYDSILGQGW